MDKKFTVVIPMYNSEKTIKKTIDSVNMQTRNDLIAEIIVINDGSTDNSKEKVEEMLHKNIIKITLIDQENGGVSKARNSGIANVGTEWVALLDSDDMWEKNKIEIQNNIIKNHEEIDFLGGNLTFEKFKIFNKEFPYLYKASIKDICLKSFPQPSTVIFKKSIFDEIGGFDNFQNYAEDGNYFLKICKAYNFYHVQEKLVNYGEGKRGFGERGLSANLKEMYLGNKKNVRELREDKNISISFYLFMNFFNYSKFLRRKLITFFSN